MANEMTFTCSDGAFYACDYGSRFLGCCDDNDEDRVCGEGCETPLVHPAYFDSSFFDKMNSTPFIPCDDGHVWYVCEESAVEEQSFFGCYALNQDPCPSDQFDLYYLINATAPESLTDSDPYPLNENSAPVAVASVSSPTSTTAASSALGSTTSQTSAGSASPTDVTAPSKLPIGGIAGGVAGGFVATMALLGFLMLFCRHRRNSKKVNKAPNNESAIEDSIPLTPAPAYTATNDKTTLQASPASLLLVREIGSSNSPSRPISELSSFDTANPPIRANSFQLTSTGCIPLTSNLAHGQGSPLTNSSGVFPHAGPGAAYFGEAV